MSDWNETPSNFDTPSTKTQVNVNGKPVWPHVIGIIGIVILTLCAFILPAAIVTATNAGSKSNSDGATNSVSTTTVTTATTTFPTLRWNSTGITVAGSSSGSFGIASNLLNSPYRLFVDSSNSLYITDTGNNRIQKWLSGASSGTTVAGQASGVAGLGATQLDYPNGVFVASNGDIYVTDGNNNRVQLWTSGASSGSTVAGTTGSPGSGSSQLNAPYSVARNPSTGTMYIADFVNHRVMAYASGASSGTVVAGGNGAGTSSNQLSNPMGLYFDASSNSLVIANYAANNIVRWVLGASSWTIVAGSNTGVFGSSSTLLNNPSDVTLDSSGNVYVADNGNSRVQFFLAGQLNGTTIAGVTGSWGSASNLLTQPFGLALDSQRNLYVADTYNSRIQKFLRY